MPIGEIEIHPYLQIGEIYGATKLILGSFPVYECTDQDNEIKQQIRNNEGTIQFFYGSVHSKFWQLYLENIDNQITLPIDPLILIQSMSHRQISISDNIFSCERHGYSSEDNKLINRTYNIRGIQTLIQNGVRKILCTSKGVLSDLENKVLLQRNMTFGQVNNLASMEFQNDFVARLGGNYNQITNPIAKVFTINNITVTALAIPSPGSPQRQLHQFGYYGLNWSNYAQQYFANAFNWLTN